VQAAEFDLSEAVAKVLLSFYEKVFLPPKTQSSPRCQMMLF
jgi:hypothetical protein